MRCDSHVHIVAPIALAPQAPDRTYLAAPAPLARLIENGRARGIERFVIVQPSFYGTDNRVLLDALGTLGERGRGVVVLAPSTAKPELSDAHQRGVRGVRVNLYSPSTGGASAAMCEVFAAGTALARPMGWHVEVIAPLPVLLAHAVILRGAPVPVVLDHYGLYGTTRPVDPEGRQLLDLVRMPHVWMKLSAPYRHDRGTLNVVPDRDWVSALLDAAPDRCVWGSDWPHPPPHDLHRGPTVSTPYRPLSYSDLVDRFVESVGDAPRASAVLGTNAMRLYDFQEVQVGT